MRIQENISMSKSSPTGSLRGLETTPIGSSRMSQERRPRLLTYDIGYGILRDLPTVDTPDKYSAISYKEDILFAFLHTKTLLKMVLL